VIFFQGNGMLFDMIESHLPGFVRIALTSSCKIIGIETPLAPEYSAQQINQLSFDVVKTIIEQASELDIDTNNLILAGYSGGGNLVANIATRARDEHSFPIRHLFLLSPSLDFTLETRINSPYAAYQDMDPAGTVESIKPALKLYYQDNDPSLPLISPIFAANLSALPPTTIIIAEFDGCRGDGEAYALRLKEAGVPVEVIICEGQTHLYFMARGVLDDAPDPAIVMGQKIADMNASEH
jgi:acetyl esterase